MLEQELAEQKMTSKEIFDGRILHVFEDTVLLPNGKSASREYLRHIGAVCIIPLLHNGDVLVERQYRYPVGQVLTEIPAGKLDSRDEDHLLAELGTSDVLSLAPGLVADLGLALVVEGGKGADEVVEDRGDELLAGPERVGLVDAGRDDVDELGGLALVEAADGDVEQLLVLLAGQEGVSLGQEEAGGDVVLQGEIAEGPDTWMRPRRGEPSLAETY